MSVPAVFCRMKTEKCIKGIIQYKYNHGNQAERNEDWFIFVAPKFNTPMMTLSLSEDFSSMNTHT